MRLDPLILASQDVEGDARVCAAVAARLGRVRRSDRALALEARKAAGRCRRAAEVLVATAAALDAIARGAAS